MASSCHWRSRRAERLPNDPDVPAAAETVPELIAPGWQAVVAPANYAGADRGQGERSLRAALNMPDVKEQLAMRGSYARPMSPAEVTAFIRAQKALWKPAVERSKNT